MQFPPEKLYFSYKMTIKKAFRTVKEKDQHGTGRSSESAVTTGRNTKTSRPQRGTLMTGGLRRPQKGRRRSAPHCSQKI